MIYIVTGASVMMYAGAPLALGALRKSKPDLARSYRLPGAGVIAPLSFVLANFIVYWSGWNTVSLLMAVLIIGYMLDGALRRPAPERAHARSSTGAPQCGSSPT